MKPDPAALLSYPAGAPLSRGTMLAFLLLAALLAWLLGWYWGTAAGIEASWSRSQTFQHGYLIIPISAWLIWRRRGWLMQIPPAPVFWPLAVLALLGFGWLLAELAQVVVVRQYALVLMVPVLVTIMLGARFAWALAFPLAFLAFTVPFGDFLIPPLMNFTADFTVGALRMTGIPVYREGMQFSLPSGNWSVVEACSGLRYLIAAITLGCLYAYLTYRTVKYRVVFIALSVVVPIIANGIRAYLIVMIGHFSNMQLAVGVDHLIYGWVFFGVVIMLLFWAGSFWREDTEPETSANPAQPVMAKPQLAKLFAVMIAGAGVIAFWPSYAAMLARPANVATVQLSIDEVAGWKKVAAPIAGWQPHYLTPRARIHQTFEKNGRAVGLFIGYYYNQTEDVKLISSLNALTVTEEKEWATTQQRQAHVPHDGQPIRVQESILRGREMQLLAWEWFWVDGQHSDNPVAVKLLQARSRLMGRGDSGGVVILYTRFDTRTEAAVAALQEFARDALPVIERSLSDAGRN